MERLTNDQLQRLRDFVSGQGVTFKPLLEEMTDHVSCDIEERMRQGLSFEQSLEQLKNNIPVHHFESIQTETMNIIVKPFAISRRLSWIALALLFVSIVFKALHLRLASELFIASLSAMTASLLTGSISGIYLHKNKKGAIRLLAVVIGVILLLTAFVFAILHLPGRSQLVLIAVAVLMASLVVNTIYVYQRATGEGNLLTYLHAEYSPGIERFLLYILFPVALFRISMAMAGINEVFSSLILLIVNFGAALQFFVLNWRTVEHHPSRKDNMNMVALLVIIILYIQLYLGHEFVPVAVRVTSLFAFTAISAWLVFRMEVESENLFARGMIVLVPIVFAGWACMHFNLIPLSLHSIFFNIPVALILIAGLIASRKHGLLRTWMILQVSGYLFEFMQGKGHL